MPKTVMIQRGSAHLEPLRGDGQYLESFDFEKYGGQGEIVLTPDVAEAMKFDDLSAAMRFRNTSPACRPIRADGLPNRPLTAANWEFVQVPE